MLLAALEHGRDELDEAALRVRRRRSRCAFAAGAGALFAATPAPAGAPRRPRRGRRARLAARRRGRRRARRAGEPGPARRARRPAARAGDLDGFLLLGLPGGRRPADLDELAPLAFDEHAGGSTACAPAPSPRPARLLEGPELREPIGAHHPLRVAEAVARLGGQPRGPALGRGARGRGAGAPPPAQAARAVRPHEDPDPARRVARRILQRLDGMGKWGGYHTDFAHLARGFAGNERTLAQDVGEALLEAGLLAEKPSVGQRHVFLNPRRAAEIRRLIDEGALPAGMRLPSA